MSEGIMGGVLTYSANWSRGICRGGGKVLKRGSGQIYERKNPFGGGRRLSSWRGQEEKDARIVKSMIV